MCGSFTRRLSARLKDLYRQSIVGRVAGRVRRAVRGVGRVAGDLAARSWLVGVLETVAGWTRTSRLYGWLTTDPDARTVVIDLRETATVGPFLPVLDRLFDGLSTAWRASTTGRVLSRAAGIAGQARTVRVVASVLEPPEPPGDSDSSTRETGETDPDR